MSNQEIANKITELINKSISCVTEVLHDKRDKITDSEYGQLLQFKSDIFVQLHDKLQEEDINEICDMLGFEKFNGSKFDMLMKLKHQSVVCIKYILSNYT